MCFSGYLSLCLLIQGDFVSYTHSYVATVDIRELPQLYPQLIQVLSTANTGTVSKLTLVLPTS